MEPRVERTHWHCVVQAYEDEDRQGQLRNVTTLDFICDPKGESIEEAAIGAAADMVDKSYYRLHMAFEHFDGACRPDRG